MKAHTIHKISNLLGRLALLALPLMWAACSGPPPAVAPAPAGSGDASPVDSVEDTTAGETTDTLGGACQSDEACSAKLTDTGVCRHARCDLLSGTCVTAQDPDGMTCEDGNECTTNDICVAGSCLGGVPKNCDDDNPCTEDTCAPESGCSSIPMGGPCDDGDPCTSGDQCVGGACVSSGASSCDDGNPCTEDGCTPEEGCTHAILAGTACEDNNACSEASYCTGAGVCAGTSTLSCNDGDICTIDSCDPAVGCVNSPTTSPCNDGDPCTGPDTCTEGVCLGAPVGCDDNNPCTNDSCSASEGCIHDAFQGPCDDGNPCTEGELCDEQGGCEGTPVDCEDNNSCTLTYCDPTSGCTATVLQGSACEDGDLCTVFDACDEEGACVPGPAPNCSDGNACTNDFCDSDSGCQNEAFAGPCDDGNPCTTGETCQQGFCAGDLTDCDDDNVCTDDACSIVWGCVNTPNTAPCDDQSVCTVTQSCVDGECTGPLLDCSDGNPCTEDICHQVEGCSNPNLPDGDPCHDGDLCTVNDYCESGFCMVTGELLECSDDDECTADGCEPELGCTFPTEPACLPPTAWPVINEIDYDQFGEDTADFIELIIVGDQTVTIALYTIELFDGDTQQIYDIIHLGAVAEQMHPGERLVIGPPSIANAVSENSVGVVVPGDFLQNGGTNGDAVRVIRNGFEIMDAVSYEAPVLGASEGGGHVGFDSDLLNEGLSFGRCPDGLDTDDNASDFNSGAPTPGLPNDCPAESVPTFWDDVQPIFMTWCGSCHAGDSVQGCAGQACFVSHYAATQMPSKVCAEDGTTVGACTVIRILEGSMPQDAPGVVPEEDIQVIGTWLATGMQQGSEPDSGEDG